MDMNNKERIRLSIGAAINIAVFAIAFYCLIIYVGRIVRGGGNRLIYYTNISNITVGFVSLIHGILLIISIFKRKIVVPKVFSIIKYVVITMTTLTFFVVLFVIWPLTSFMDSYGEIRFFTHFFNPVIIVISYLFFEERISYDWKYSLFGILPAFIYSIIYSINVIGLGIWPDIYYINTKGLWYLYLLGINIGGFGLNQALYFIKKKIIEANH